MKTLSPVAFTIVPLYKEAVKGITETVTTAVPWRLLGPAMSSKDVHRCSRIRTFGALADFPVLWLSKRDLKSRYIM